MKLILQALKSILRKIEASIDNAQTTADNAKSAVDSKMSATNPVASGSFSMGRASGSTVGRYSHAEGFNATASGYCSHAEGFNATASGYCAHSEGEFTKAIGDDSHSEGKGTIAKGKYQHVQGRYNVEDPTTVGTYAHIVGNGTDDDKRSNAHTLDWNGNAWFAGEVKVGGTGQYDHAAKTLATTEDIPVVDSTLTKSGQAADAAAVGDRLSALSEEIVTTSESKVAAHNTGTDTHSDIRLLIQGLTDRLNAMADSDDTTLDQLSEVVAYIKSNRSLIEAITTSKVSVADIVDNLTTNVSSKPLSAAQGVALKALIDGIVIPDKLPNPNALTFTGAVTGSYDGSEPLSVEIPSGGGGLSDYELIDTLDWSTEELAQLGAGKEYSFEEIQDILLVYTGLANDTTTVSGLGLVVNNIAVASGAEPMSGKSGEPLNGYVFLHSIPGIGLFSLKSPGVNASNNYAATYARIAYNLHPVAEKITKFKIHNRVFTYCTNMGILKIYVR